jgi:hypothetical protein
MIELAFGFNVLKEQSGLNGLNVSNGPQQLWRNSARPPSITPPKLRPAIVHYLHPLQQKPDKLAAKI